MSAVHGAQLAELPDDDENLPTGPRPIALPPVRRSAGSRVTEQFVLELRAMLANLVAHLPLFADLRRRGVEEDIVQDALLAVTSRLEAGHPIDQPFAYARTCVINLAKRAYADAARESSVGHDQLELLAPLAADVADQVEQRAEMTEVLDMVRSVGPVIADLDPIALELVRAELERTDQKDLARRLGISRPTLYRRKGPAIAAFVASVAQRAGTRPCPEHAGALLAAAGASGFRAAQEASAHAAGCEECRATIRHLQVARHGLAIIGPIPLVTTSDASHRAAAGFFERLHAAADALIDAVRQAVVRVGDPTPLTGPAGKTAAIVAAACTGGGGVYCAIEGVPATLRAPFEQHASTSATPRTAAREAAVSRPPQTTRVASTAAGSSVAIATGATAGAVVRKAEAQRAVARRVAARRRAAAAAATRQEAAREFARQRAAASASATAATEFGTSTPTSGTSATASTAAREFGAGGSAGAGNTSAGTSQAKREFGSP